MRPVFGPVVVERALWAGAAIASALAIVGARGARVAPPSVTQPALAAPAAPPRVMGDSIARAATHAAENDPFRLDQHPSSVAYDPALEGMPQPDMVRPPRPTLVLRGIIGGPPWSAIVEGVPGRSGSVLLRRGDTLSGLTIRAVGRDTVILKGSDTTWRLGVQRAW